MREWRADGHYPGLILTLEYKIEPWGDKNYNFDFNHRVGCCWMEGRLKKEDYIMCLAHAGDCFWHYCLLDISSSNCTKLILESRFGAYTLGEPIEKQPSKEIIIGLLTGCNVFNWGPHFEINKGA